MFEPNQLGAAAAAVPANKASADKVKKAANTVKKIRAQIDSAYKQYSGAEDARVALKKAEAKMARVNKHLAKAGVKTAAGKKIPLMVKTNKTATVSNKKPRKPFKIDEKYPWRVQLLNKNGTALNTTEGVRPARRPKDSTTHAIEKAEEKLPKSVVDKLRKRERKRAEEVRDVDISAHNEKRKFQTVDVRLKQNTTAISRGVAEKVREIQHKANEKARKEA
jgi:hypothetical protein